MADTAMDEAAPKPQVWRITGGKPGHRNNRFRENNGRLETLGGDGINDWFPSIWASLDQIRAAGFILTEVAEAQDGERS